MFLLKIDFMEIRKNNPGSEDSRLNEDRYQRTEADTDAAALHPVNNPGDEEGDEDYDDEEEDDDVEVDEEDVALTDEDLAEDELEEEDFDVDEDDEDDEDDDI